nr:hypothetical protein [Caldimonas thermodepolymerans]
MAARVFSIRPANRFAKWDCRALAASQSSCGMIRSSGASPNTHSLSGFATVGVAPRIGVLHLALAVPDQAANVEFAIEDAGADFPVAANDGIAPSLSGRAGNAVAVEVCRNALRPLARDIFAEDAANHLGLFLDDLALAPDRLAARVELVDDAIAIGIAAADLARLHTPPDAAMGLDGEVLQEQRVHGAFQADMKLVDLAFRQGEDRHARKAQPLEDACHVLLIAADAVERLRQHHVETARLRIGQKRLDAGADEGCAGNGSVGIGFHHRPALARRAFPALAQLVLDRGITLVVGGIARVKGNADHGGKLRSVSP